MTASTMRTPAPEMTNVVLAPNTAISGAAAR